MTIYLDDLSYKYTYFDKTRKLEVAEYVVKIDREKSSLVTHFFAESQRDRVKIYWRHHRHFCETIYYTNDVCSFIHSNITISDMSDSDSEKSAYL